MNLWSCEKERCTAHYYCTVRDPSCRRLPQIWWCFRDACNHNRFLSLQYFHWCHCNDLMATSFAARFTLGNAGSSRLTTTNCPSCRSHKKCRNFKLSSLTIRNHSSTTNHDLPSTLSFRSPPRLYKLIVPPWHGNAVQSCHRSSNPTAQELRSKMAFIPVSSFIGLRVVNKANTVCQAPPRVGRWTMKGGKGFGGGEATRE